MFAQVDGSESWGEWGLHKAEDAAIGAAEATAMAMFAQVDDSESWADIGSRLLNAGFAQVDDSESWADIGSRLLNAGFAQVDGSQDWTDIAEYEAITGAGFAQAEAEAEDVDSIVDQVGNLSLDDVYKAGADAWNDLAQTDAERIHGHNRR